MTHGNNVFRMQVAVGMDLEAFYCEDTVQALRDESCLIVNSVSHQAQVQVTKVECRELLKEAT